MSTSWKYNKDSDCYLYGEPKNGCGVFFDDTVGGWVYNVVVGNNITSDYNFINCKEKCMEKALEELDRRRNAWNNGVVVW